MIRIGPFSGRHTVQDLLHSSRSHRFPCCEERPKSRPEAGLQPFRAAGKCSQVRRKPRIAPTGSLLALRRLARGRVQSKRRGRVVSAPGPFYMKFGALRGPDGSWLGMEYSLVSRGPETSIFPVLAELGIGVTAYGVLSSGVSPRVT